MTPHSLRPLAVEEPDDDRVETASPARLPLTLKPAEAAAELRISRAKIYDLIAAKQIPVIHVGKYLRISTEALREWIARQGER